MRVHTHTRTHYTCAYTHTHALIIHARTHTHTHYTCAYTHTHALIIHARTHTHTHTHYTRTHTHTHTHKHTLIIRTHACTHTHTINKHHATLQAPHQKHWSVAEEWFDDVCRMQKVVLVNIFELPEEKHSSVHLHWWKSSRWERVCFMKCPLTLTIKHFDLLLRTI